MKRILRILLGIAAAGACAAVWIPFFAMRVFNLGTVSVTAAGVPLMIYAFCPKSAARIGAGLNASRCGRILRRTAVAVLAAAVLYIGTVTAWMGAVCARTPQEGAPLIVLGCMIRGNQPSPMLAQRLKRALRYLNEQPDAVCVVSGGQGADEPYAEGDVMAEWLIAHGISSARILRETRSANTEQNIAYSMEMLRARGISTAPAICTDWWHVLRASIWANRLGVRTASAPCATYASLGPVYYARELCAMMRMILCGY